MLESGIQILPERDAVNQIVQTVRHAKAGSAPFVLVLGSGFSQGLVPTVKELVTECLPLWMRSLDGGESFDVLKEKPVSEKSEIARGFWKQMVAHNIGRGLDLPLDSTTGLPCDYASAYKVAFNSSFFGAVGAPADARRLQRALMRLDQSRLNAAHFLLASILGVQPGKKCKSALFKAEAAFSRLILTTNFDPFMQTALQAVNRLYIMSDNPSWGVTDEILDDETDAIHLVYVHGSIHRRGQAASEKEIQDLKRKNAQMLAPVLKRHGVIVLGYSGWDDAILQALADCETFDNRLYWCGLEADPRAFGPRVNDILRKPAALYVETKGAGPFMAQLCSQLVSGLPRLLANPIGQLRELLDTIDLKELEAPNPTTSNGTNMAQPLDSMPPEHGLVQAKESTLQRLGQAELAFKGSSLRGAQNTETKTSAQWLLASAQLAIRLNNHLEALRLCDEALALPLLESSDLVGITLQRGSVNVLLGNLNGAVQDWTNAIHLPGTTVEQLAEAFTERAFTYGKMSESDKEIADYSHVIEQLSGLQVGVLARALNNRGFAYFRKGEFEKALADYTQVIDQLTGVPVGMVAWTLINRATTFEQVGELDKAIADCSHVIEQLPGARIAQVASALYNRGLWWGQKGEIGKELADYTRVIEQLPGAEIVQTAKSLYNRGVRLRQLGEGEKAVADFTRVIEDLPGAPVEQVAQALLGRAAEWHKNGDMEKVLAQYTRVIEQLPGAPVELVARALCSRALVWRQKGETEKELADYSHVIERLAAAPDEQMAIALAARGWLHYSKGDFANFQEDTERAVSVKPTLDFATFNLGLALMACGRDGDALAAYERAGKAYPAAIEKIGISDLIDAQETWLSKERAVPPIQLLERLKQQTKLSPANSDDG
jgi:tetratricopeptide (TPR) repeat protein